MNLDYKTTTVKPDLLRTMHIIIIDSEILTTTREKEVFQFAKSRGIAKFDWRDLKEAVRTGKPLSIRDKG